MMTSCAPSFLVANSDSMSDSPESTRRGRRRCGEDLSLSVAQISTVSPLLARGQRASRGDFSERDSIVEHPLVVRARHDSCPVIDAHPPS